MKPLQKQQQQQQQQQQHPQPEFPGDDEGRHDPEPYDVHVHPMVPVPDAILCVLREASRIGVGAASAAAAEGASPLLESLNLYEDNAGERTTRKRSVAHDVVVPPPGYPPYRASIMDGYAISTSTQAYSKEDPSSCGASQRRRFLVAGKVHAGANHPLDDEAGGAALPCDAAPKAAGTSLTSSDNDVPPPPSPPSLPWACYVTTGAVVPDAFDCVVPLEDVTVTIEDLHFNAVSNASTTTTTIELLDTADVRPGRWIRAVGFDLPAGTIAVKAGQELDATAVGLLRQAGRSEVDVLPRVRIGVLSTGNEIRDDPRWFQPATDGGGPSVGTIPDVNRPVLMNLYKSWNNCDAIDLGIVTDSDDAAIRDALVSAMDVHDCQVIVTTGGISVGEMDRMEPVLKSLDATLHFGRLHMKPGKPTTLATIRDNRMVFCLPGNPVSAIVCSHLLVRPCLDLLYQAPLVLLRQAEQGEESPTFESSEDLQRRVMEDLPVLHPEVPVVMQNDVVLDAERPEYHRVRLRPVVDTTTGKVAFEAHSTGVQQSSRLASMNGAHAVVLLPQATPQQRTVAKGTLARALLLDGGGGGIFPRLKLGESLHMKEGVAGSRDVAPITGGDSSGTGQGADTSTRRLLAVDVVLVRCAKPTETESSQPDASDVTQQVQQALGSGPSSPFRVVSNRAYTYQGDMFSPPTVWEEAILGGGERSVEEESDVQIVAYEGPMLQQLQLASFLKTVLSKLAPALEMDARQGIATVSCTAAALFDVVVGVVDSTSPVSVMSAAGDHAVVRDAVEGELPNPSKRRRVFLLLPVAGLTGALMATRRQIRHAVKISQQSG